MARRLGPYTPLSATYASDDAMIAAGEKAELLYVRALAFCASSDSDGYITEAQLLRYVGVAMPDAAKRAARLVEVELWERVDGGCVVRAWLKWNASAEELGRARTRDRERKRAARPAEPPPDSGPPSDRIPSGIHAESNGSPDGVRTESSGLPPRAPTRASAQPPAQPPARAGHSTALHDTSLHGTSQHPAARTTPTMTGNELLDEHVAAWPTPIPRDVRQRTGEQIDKLLAEGFSPETMRKALALLRQHTNLGPGVLPSLVVQAMNPPSGRPESRYDRNRRILRATAERAGNEMNVIDLAERKAVE